MNDRARFRLRDLRLLPGRDRRSADAEVDDELAFHIEMETRRHVEAGVPAAEARRRALLSFGGVERYREATMSVRPTQYLEDIRRDVVQGARALLRSPAHALLTILAIALGIGAATAMFSVVDGVLVRPLVYGSSDRLFTLYESRETQALRSPSYPSFEDWTRELTAFEALSWIRGDEFRLRGEEGTQRLLAGYVSPAFFRTVEAAAMIGRVLEEQDADAHVVVLSHDVWRTRFGSDRDIVGRSVATADASYTVVGVMPRGFRIPVYADVWVPLRTLPPDARHVLTRRDMHVDAESWGLVRAGISPEQAKQDLERVIAGLSAQYPEAGAEWTQARLLPVREQLLGSVGDQLRILGAAVALVLLIVCVNVAGLQLARGSARTREIAVRASLGASRSRLVRQLLTESLLIAVIGGVVGALLATGAVTLLAERFPSSLPRLDEVSVNTRALAFALAASLLAALGFGVLPALRSSAPVLAPALREGTGGAGTSGGQARLRRGLLVMQVALAIVLTVGSTLLLRSLWTLREVDPGFEPDRVALLRVFPPAHYDDADAAAALYARLHEAVRRVPGVEQVALTNHAPLAGGFMTTRFVSDSPPPEGGDVVIIRTVSSEYFDVMGSRLIRGRLLEDADFTDGGGGMVINDVVARHFFGDTDPLGRTVTIFRSAQGRPDFGEPLQATVVGVVRAERVFNLEQDPPRSVFVPYTWMIWPNITLAVRTEGAPLPVLPALRQAVHRVDQDIPVAGPSRQAQWLPLTDFVGGTLQQRRLVAGLLGTFAGVALVLSMLGIFGMTTFLVTRRTREIGVRLALGASAGSIARLVLGHALVLTALGVCIGLPGAWAATRLLQSQLFGVTPFDPASIAGAVLIFPAAALLGAALPAWRALRIAPTQALRAE